MRVCSSRDRLCTWYCRRAVYGWWRAMKGDTAKERVSKQSLRRVSDRIRLGQREREGREECECAHRRPRLSCSPRRCALILWRRRTGPIFWRLGSGNLWQLRSHPCPRPSSAPAPFPLLTIYRHGEYSSFLPFYRVTPFRLRLRASRIPCRAVQFVLQQTAQLNACIFRVRRHSNACISRITPRWRLRLPSQC